MADDIFTVCEPRADVLKETLMALRILLIEPAR